MFLIILNKWSHLEDEDWQLTTTNVAKTTHTCNVLAVISPLKWSILTTIGPRTTRMMVYVCLLWQRLRHWFLPSATSNHLLSVSSAQNFGVRIKVQAAAALWMSASLASHPLPDLQPRYFLFNLRLWENTGQSVTTCESPDQSLKKRRQHGANDIQVIKKLFSFLRKNDNPGRGGESRGRFQLFFEPFS